MKIVFFTTKNEMMFSFDFKVDVLDEKHIVKDIPEIDENIKNLLSQITQDFYVYTPINEDCDDFYLQYYNHINLYTEKKYNLIYGSRISKTLIDEKQYLLKILQEVHKTGETQEYNIYYLNDKGHLIKSMIGRFIKYNDSVVILLDNNTENILIRTKVLMDTSYGVPIYQDDKYVLTNSIYDKAINRPKDQIIDHPMDFSVLDDETVQKIKECFNDILNFKIFSENIIAEAKEEDGSLKYYFNLKFSYTIYKDNPAIFILLQDLTESEKNKRMFDENFQKDERLKEYKNNLNLNDHICGMYQEEDGFLKLSGTFYNIIEDDSKTYSYKNNYFKDLILEEDFPILENALKKINIKNPNVDFFIRIKSLKGNIKYIQNWVTIDYSPNGDILKLNSIHYDTTDDLLEYDRLREIISKKDKEIYNKNMLFKEVHHRIKNNLQIILSLISIDEHMNKEDPLKIIQNTKTQINAISLMYQKIYNSTDFANLNLKEYLDNIVESLLNMYHSDIKYISKIDDIELNNEQAISLGLIVNELINNTIKYAFPNDEEGTITIKARRINKTIDFEYRDSGIGLPEDTDFKNSTSLGLMVINNLSEQINGDAQYHYDNGTVIKIPFKEEDKFANTE